MGSRLIRVLWISVMSAAFLGCGSDGPELGSVEGTVTLDGQPLAGATVIFEPQAGGAASMGRTDEDGDYELTYSSDRDGALLGNHSVMIRTGEVIASEEEGKEGTPIVTPEKVPTKYNDESDLVREVKPGNNTHDFKLDSQGEIIQPVAGEEDDSESEEDD